MDERISGFVVTGDWGEVVEHGERVTWAMQDVLASRNAELSINSEEEELGQWDEWRPKSHELLDRNIRKKTAHYASIGEGPGEQVGQSMGDDLQTAGEVLAESYRKLESDDTSGAVARWQNSLGHVARAADSASRKALRMVEEAVYTHLMTQVSPYYFDNELISANVRQTRLEDGPFIFEINVNDDDLKEAVSNRLQDFESETDRWHIDAEKHISSAEAAEGLDVSESRSDGVDGRTT